MTKPPLSEAQLRAWLDAHPEWKLDGSRLTRTFEAPTFLKGIAFVQEVAKRAEALDHHPDIDIRWRRVTLGLMTHDAGDRVTELDTGLAADCERAFAAVQ